MVIVSRGQIDNYALTQSLFFHPFRGLGLSDNQVRTDPSLNFFSKI